MYHLLDFADERLDGILPEGILPRSEVMGRCGRDCCLCGTVSFTVVVATFDAMIFAAKWLFNGRAGRETERHIAR